MNFHVLTLFPEMVMDGLKTSVTGRAIQQGKIGVEAVDIRDYTEEKHGRVDDYTYGGGAGMLMQAQPVYDAFVSVRERIPESHSLRVIYVTPQGSPFTQQTARELAKNDDLVLLCGHYEGVDERVLEEIVTDYISIGDFVLTGGELAAMMIVDAVARLVPFVLHNDESALMESFHNNLLEYPQYSRPKEWRGRRVPDVLLSGNQKEIDRWRRQKAEERTAERRPDLYARYLALQECEELLLSDKLRHMDMIELIRRGRAHLVARRGDELLLEDEGSHVIFHAWPGYERLAGEGEPPVASLLAELELSCGHPASVVLHQEAFVGLLVQRGYHLQRECRQCVCTRREQLSISGLYGADGRNPQNGLELRQLTGPWSAPVEELCALCESEKTPLERGELFGAFVDGVLAGVIGAREEGCVDLLAVHPQYRRKKIATALETYLFNRQIRGGMTPYGQAVSGNAAFVALQEKLGVYVAKGKLYWLKKG